MLPARQQQLLLFLALIALVALAHMLLPGLGNDGGYVAVELSSAGLAGLVGWIVIAAIFALVASALGNVVAGAALLAAGLLVPATAGGSMEAWLRANAEPGRYMTLVVDAVIWMVPFIVLALVVRSMRSGLRRRLPKLLQAPHFQELAEDEQSSPFQSAAAAGPVLGAVAVAAWFNTTLIVDFVATLLIGLMLLTLAWLASMVVRTFLDRGSEGFKWRPPLASTFLGSVVAMAVGAAVTMMLMVSLDTGQTIGAVVIAFMLGGLAGHQMFPTPSRMTFILAPLALGIAAYGWTAATIDDAPDLLARLFQPFGKAGGVPLLPLALVLPVQYASAGVLGVLLGVGWSQSLHVASEKHVTVATT